MTARLNCCPLAVSVPVHRAQLCHACCRAAAQPALALHFLREAVITNLEGLVHSLAPAQLAQLLWTETLASLLAVLVSSCASWMRAAALQVGAAIQCVP